MYNNFFKRGYELLTNSLINSYQISVGSSLLTENHWMHNYPWMQEKNTSSKCSNYCNVRRMEGKTKNTYIDDKEAIKTTWLKWRQYEQTLPW